MKGESRFPDLGSERVRMSPEQRMRKRRIFHQANLDVLHNCGNCQDDFQGDISFKMDQGVKILFTGLNSGRCYAETREYYNKENNTMIIFK